MGFTFFLVLYLGLKFTAMIEITDKPCKTIEVRKGTITFYVGYGCEKYEWEFDVHTTKNGTVSHEVFMDDSQIRKELPEISDENLKKIRESIEGTVLFNLEKQTVKYV